MWYNIFKERGKIMFDELIIAKEDFDNHNIEDIKNYLYELTNRDGWLEKRVGFAFKKKPWLKQYGTQEDIQQNYYLRLFKQSTMKSLMSRDLVARMKYINKIISGCISDTVRRNITLGFVPLNEECIVSTYDDSNMALYNHLQELFVDESIEIQVMQMLSSGMTHKEVMETLDLSRRNYEKIKELLKNKIIELQNEN
jgi:hypothetical protein